MKVIIMITKPNYCSARIMYKTFNNNNNYKNNIFNNNNYNNEIYNNNN